MNIAKIFYTFGVSFVFFLLFLYFFHPITNLVGDLGYYLKIGEIISHTGSIPDTNLFSYTNASFPFLNPNWLSEVIFYWVYSTFGFNALILLSVGLIIAAFLPLFIVASKKYSPFATLLLSLLSIHILFERTDIKPELFSFFFLSVFIVILYRYKQHYTKWIFALIPLELLWVNMHIYFFVGLLVIACFLLDAAIANRHKLGSSKFVVLLWVSMGSFLVTVINPQFIKGALYPLFVMNNYAFSVEENISFFSALTYNTPDPTLPFFGVSLAILWIGILFAFKKLSFVDILLSLAFTVLSLSTVRTFPLFVLATFIPLVKIVSFVMQLLAKKVGQEHLLAFQTTIFCIICLILSPTITGNIQLHGLGFGVNDQAGAAIRFVEKNNLHGPVYNNYDIGNYLDFKLYPKEKVFADARPEAYPKSFFQDTYIPMQESLQTFKKKSNDYHFNLIIIKHTDPTMTKLLSELVKDANWEMVYLNNTVVIFLKNTQANQVAIKKHLVTQDRVLLEKNDVDTKEKVGRLVNFFRAVGWDKQWLAMNEKYLEFEPSNCSALQNIAYIKQKQNAPDAPIYLNKFLQSCSR
jgi:hypothetical protein